MRQLCQGNLALSHIPCLSSHPLRICSLPFCQYPTLSLTHPASPDSPLRAHARRRVYVAACAVVDQLVRSSAVDVILVDSVAALVPQAEIEGEMGMVQVYA